MLLAADFAQYRKHKLIGGTQGIECLRRGVILASSVIQTLAQRLCQDLQRFVRVGDGHVANLGAVLGHLADALAEESLGEFV